MGSQTCKLCTHLRKTEKGRLSPPALGQPIRREHILGERQWLDPYTGSGCMDRWEEMVWLCQKYLLWTWLHSLHSGCMEDHHQCWLRQDYMQLWRYFHHLQLLSTGELHRSQALLIFININMSTSPSTLLIGTLPFIHSFFMYIHSTACILSKLYSFYANGIEISPFSHLFAWYSLNSLDARTSFSLNSLDGLDSSVPWYNRHIPPSILVYFN